MSCQSDCPICLDAIIGLTNSTTTECGHHFHTKCLMQNAVHNGFGCPYCRTILAEPPKDDDSDSEYDRDDDSFLEEEEENENYTLEGFRFFHQRINNEELEQEEFELIIDENQEQPPMAPFEDVNISFKASGITYEQLLEYILEDYKNEHEDNLFNNNSYKKIYTKLRQIDSVYTKKVKNDRNNVVQEMHVNE